jgi:hypothetical protein
MLLLVIFICLPLRYGLRRHQVIRLASCSRRPMFHHSGTPISELDALSREILAWMFPLANVASSTDEQQHSHVSKRTSCPPSSDIVEEVLDAFFAKGLSIGPEFDVRMPLFFHWVAIH